MWENAIKTGRGFRAEKRSKNHFRVLTSLFQNLSGFCLSCAQVPIKNGN